MPKILAIDDESSCLEIITFSLNSRGYEVVGIDSGVKAVEHLLQNTSGIDLILLDMMMPGMNGIETLAKIREIDSARFIPVIFQTGASDCNQSKIHQDAGAEYMIHKPYKRDELIEVIKNALENEKE